MPTRSRSPRSLLQMRRSRKQHRWKTHRMPVGDSKCTKHKSMDVLSLLILINVVLTSHRRHRQRKTEYSKTLEADKSRLSYQNAIVNYESQRLDRENAALRGLLASHGLLDEIDKPSSDAASNRRSSDGSTHPGIICSSPEESSLATSMSPEIVADRPNNRKGSLALDLHLEESRSKVVRTLLLRDVKGYECVHVRRTKRSKLTCDCAGPARR